LQKDAKFAPLFTAAYFGVSFLRRNNLLTEKEFLGLMEKIDREISERNYFFIKDQYTLSKKSRGQPA